MISAKRSCDMVYGFVGLGLMGGSFARAIRLNILDRSTAAGKILACDRQENALHRAIFDGVIDGGFLPDEVDEMLSQCDVVFICLYPCATIEFLKSKQHAFKSGAIITDISGVKAQVVSILDEWTRDDVDFISGHPMAGNEKEGYANGSANIFHGRNYIIVPHKRNNPKNLEFLKTLAAEVGFTHIVDTTAQNHDHQIAFTSQLCHVIASALIDSAEDTGVIAFGGGSFEDLTRIAMINAPLWTELFLTNKKELLGCIDEFLDSMQKIRQCVDTADKDTLVSILENVRSRRISMSYFSEKR